jgi:4-amino-4-deoxy-L-arabinose transferase-like glycosyltransferase
LGLGLFFLLLIPAFWALTPVLGSGQRVEASPDLLSGSQGSGVFQRSEAPFHNAKLLAFLESHRHGEPILVVAQNSQSIASIIIETGEPAVALGGFMGGDPILTVHQFEQKVKDGQFRYMLLPDLTERQSRGDVRGLGGNGRGFGGGMGFGRMGGSQADIAKWVRENGKLVDPSLWKPTIAPSASTSQVLPQDSSASQTLPGAWGNRRGGWANLQLYDLTPDLEKTGDSTR